MFVLTMNRPWKAASVLMLAPVFLRPLARFEFKASATNAVIGFQLGRDLPVTEVKAMKSAASTT